MFAELFFPFGALWHFSVVSLERHTFGSSRLSENEIRLSAFACSDRGLQGWYCGDSVSIVSNTVRQAGVRTLTAPVVNPEEHRVRIYISTRNATSMV